MRLPAMLLLIWVTATGAAEPPRRIVSANLCADRLVAALADHDRIVSLSYHAGDPQLSTILPLAATLPLNHADAEEIAALDPDLVIFGMYSSKAAATMLKNLGIPVYLLPLPRTLDEMRGNIRALAARLGVALRGEALIAEIDRGLADLHKARDPVRAVIVSAGGWTHGKGSIDDDILHLLGASNVATSAGIGSVGTLSLEQLVAEDPQLVVIEQIGADQPSLATKLLDHPVLSGHAVKRLEMPMKLWQCIDASVVEAAHLIDGAL